MELTDVDYKRGEIVRDFVMEYPNRSKADIARALTAASSGRRALNPVTVSLAIRAARHLLYAEGASARLIVDRSAFTYSITDDQNVIRKHAASNRRYADTRATTEYWNTHTHRSDASNFTAHRDTVVKLHKQLTRKAA